MRTQVVLSAVTVLAAVLLSPATGSAQGSPSTQDIIKSLTPTGISGPTRGIRVGPSAAPTQTRPQVTSAPAVSLTVQFATGSAELAPQAIQTLDRLGQALTDRSLGCAEICGATDWTGGGLDESPDPPPPQAISDVESSKCARCRTVRMAR